MKLFPFCAYHYNPALETSSPSLPLTNLITPPYDVISDKQHFLNKSIYNFAHIDLKYESNETYEMSRQLLSGWLKDNIIISSPKALYLYEQHFTLFNQPYTRRSIFGMLRLSDFDSGIVRPHEKIFTQYKTDRTILLEKTNFQLSPIFGMTQNESYMKYLYQTLQLENKKSFILSTTDEFNVQHTLYQLSKNEEDVIHQLLIDSPFYIVDGHHRYQSQLEYSKKINAFNDPNKEASKILVALASSQDSNLVILPTHRALKKVNPNFRIENSQTHFFIQEISQEKLKQFFDTTMQTSLSSQPQFVLYYQGSYYLYTARAEKPTGLLNCQTWWSDEKLLPQLLLGVDNQKPHYVSSYQELLDSLSSYEAIIFHNPIQMTTLIEIADNKETMPQKSTYFYPKLSSGIVLANLNDCP